MNYKRQYYSSILLVIAIVLCFLPDLFTISFRESFNWLGVSIMIGYAIISSILIYSLITLFKNKRPDIRMAEVKLHELLKQIDSDNKWQLFKTNNIYLENALSFYSCWKMFVSDKKQKRIDHLNFSKYYFSNDFLDWTDKQKIKYKIKKYINKRYRMKDYPATYVEMYTRFNGGLLFSETSRKVIVTVVSLLLSVVPIIVNIILSLNDIYSPVDLISTWVGLGILVMMDIFSTPWAYKWAVSDDLKLLNIYYEESKNMASEDLKALKNTLEYYEAFQHYDAAILYLENNKKHNIPQLLQ